MDNWGILDWNEHFLYHGVPYQSIIEHGQFPLWNPYSCGGNPMLANPQSRFLSPLFLIDLAFGVVVGFADLSVPIEEVSKFLPPLLQNYDIAIGSREAEGARRYGEPLHRHIIGRIFNFIVRILLLP